MKNPVVVIWAAQSPNMRRLFGLIGFLTLFMLIHGTWTFRVNHQKAFAKAVEVKIAIETIHVKAVRGTLILTGQASKEQRVYAESIARLYIEKYSSRAINPPSSVRNDIQVESSGPSITKFRKSLSRKTVALIHPPQKAKHASLKSVQIKLASKPVYKAPAVRGDRKIASVGVRSRVQRSF